MKKSFLVVAAIIISSRLLAQQDTLISTLEDITVTATRFPKKQSETGKVVTTISQQDLQRAGGKDLAQLLNEQAGFSINGANSNPGKDKQVYLRGAKTNYTLVLLNGIPVNDPTGVGGAFDLRMFPVEQIERIEIVKGAQSTLYGSEAVAGVINIITKKGDSKPVNFYGGLSYGNYNTLKAHAGINGTLDGSSYNVTLVHNETNGVPEAKDTTAAQSYPKNGFIENSLNMDMELKVAQGLFVKPFFRHTYFTGTYADGAFQPAQNRFKSKLQSAGTQVSYHLANGSVTGLFSNDDISRSYASAWGTTPYEGNRKTAELFGHYEFAKHIQALAGIRYDRQKMYQPSSTISDTATSMVSPYLSFFIKDLGGFSFEAGARYNDHSVYGNNFTYTLNPSFLVNKNLKLFLNYGTAFRVPALTELFGQWGANPDLKPEKSNTLEGGIQSAIGRQVELRVVYFKRKIKDVIDWDNTFTYTNYDRQNDQGFEIEPTFRISESLTIKAFYNYVTGEITTNTGTKDTTYFNLIRRPKHSGSVLISYQVTPGLFVSTQLQLFGKREDLFYNSATFMNEPKTLKAYTLWNAYAEYAFAKKKIRLFGQINNILDADYYEVYGYTTLGTNFTAGFRFKL